MSCGCESHGCEGHGCERYGCEGYGCEGHGSEADQNPKQVDMEMGVLADLGSREVVCHLIGLLLYPASRLQ